MCPSNVLNFLIKAVSKFTAGPGRVELTQVVSHTHSTFFHWYFVHFNLKWNCLRLILNTSFWHHKSQDFTVKAALTLTFVSILKLEHKDKSH